ncbi:hypothetical protein GJAV_G00105110 [Gymnothorax javanicus]|nr:hypothetical protein GJAV_G00105110 [Gymnothorax javanicus]
MFCSVLLLVQSYSSSPSLLFPAPVNLAVGHGGAFSGIHTGLSEGPFTCVRLTEISTLFFGKMKEFVSLMVIFYGIQTASSDLHSLKYFYTAVTPGIEFPEFTAVSLVDDEPFTHYDSVIKKEIPKTDWVKESVDEQYWDRNTQIYSGSQQWFKANIPIAMQRFNHTQGVHTFQNMYGCEWDDESGATGGGFYQFGYDGEDFVSLDLKNLRFIGPTPQAFITTQKWNTDQARFEYLKQYFTQECVQWLQKYLSYGKNSLGRTEQSFNPFSGLQHLTINPDGSYAFLPRASSLAVWLELSSCSPRCIHRCLHVEEEKLRPTCSKSLRSVTEDCILHREQLEENCCKRIPHTRECAHTQTHTDTQA